MDDESKCMMDGSRRLKARRLEAIDHAHRGRLLAMASGMGLGKADGDDLAQDVLLALFIGGQSTDQRLVEELMAQVMSGRRRGGERRLRLAAAIASATVASRAERDGRGALWAAPT